jgi:hypothetical protein
MQVGLFGVGTFGWNNWEIWVTYRADIPYFPRCSNMNNVQATFKTTKNRTTAQSNTLLLGKHDAAKKSIEAPASGMHVRSVQSSRALAFRTPVELEATAVAVGANTGLSLEEPEASIQPKSKKAKRGPSRKAPQKATRTRRPAVEGAKVTKAKAEALTAYGTERDVVRNKVLTTLKPMLSAESYSLIQRCIDDVLSQAGAQFQIVASEKFIDDLARSANSVAPRNFPMHLESLAFKLNFNLNFRNLMEKGSKSEEDPAEKAWQQLLSNKLSPVAISSAVSCEGMSQTMLLNPEKAAVVFPAAHDLTERLLSIFPNKGIPVTKIPAYANMAMALRNVAIRQVELHGKVSDAMANAIKEAARDLLKAALKSKGGEADAVGWTIALLQVQDSKPAKAR